LRRYCIVDIVKLSPQLLFEDITSSDTEWCANVWALMSNSHTLWKQLHNQNLRWSGDGFLGAKLYPWIRLTMQIIPSGHTSEHCTIKSSTGHSVYWYLYKAQCAVFLHLSFESFIELSETWKDHMNNFF